MPLFIGSATSEPSLTKPSLPRRRGSIDCPSIPKLNPNGLFLLGISKRESVIRETKNDLWFEGSNHRRSKKDSEQSSKKCVSSAVIDHYEKCAYAEGHQFEHL